MESRTSPPIIPGFHPDPSICRVEGEYFLVTSSFEYFPGVPIFTSGDLLSWRQIGNVLDRGSQLSVYPGLEHASGGIYAPTLRFHDGRFWMITTNIHEIRRGHLLVHAEDPAGPWSDPVYTTGLIGIDPDLAWDEEGRCRVTWKDVVGGGIAQAVIDPDTGRALTEPVRIWVGTGGQHPEGPHVYAKDGWWYLVAAEGGTGPGHMVTVARSRSVDGPYEPHPDNPVLTHRSSSEPVQATGHADFVQTANGSWAMVHLGTRPRGSFPTWHVNGRETFLAGIDWVDEWPVVIEGRYEPEVSETSFVESFTGNRLHPRWISPGVDPASFASTGPAGLTLAPGRSPDEAAASALLAARAADSAWCVSVEASGDHALTVRLDDAHQAMLERVGTTVCARAVIGPLDQRLGECREVTEDLALAIRVEHAGAEPGRRRGPDRIRLGLAGADGFEELASFDGRYLSTEVAGGFTGRVVGVEALGAGVVVRRFRYEPLSTVAR